MKQVILDVLEDISKGQVNLESKAAREVVANLIMAAIKSSNVELDTAGMPIEKIDKWLTRDIDKVVELTVEELK